jgi:hypothetical protein
VAEYSFSDRLIWVRIMTTIQGSSLLSASDENLPLRPLLQKSGGNLLERNVRKVGARVLERYGAYVSAGIEIKQRVLVRVAGWGNINRPEFDRARTSVLKILNLHGSRLRSKNAF